MPRPESGKLDLPMQITKAGDLDGSVAIRALVNQVVGRDAGFSFVGAVRNVVNSPQRGYDWPTPLAHFGVWASDGTPVIDGTWVSLKDEASVLRDRHWHPLVL